MTSHKDPVRTISENPLLRDLDLKSVDKAALAGLGFAVRRYSAHTTIVQQGDEDDRTFIIHSGWGCIYKDLPDGERQIVDFTLSGDVVGMRLAKVEAQNSFATITDLTVLEAHAKSMIPGLAGSERLIETFFIAGARRKAIFIEHMTNLGRRSALARTAHLLLELGQRLESAGKADQDGYYCPLTQYDLADALGLTAIHVNRMLRELREFRFLSLRKGRVEFLDHAGLAEFAEFDAGYLLNTLANSD